MAASKIKTGIVDEFLREIFVGDTIVDASGKQYVVTRRDLASPTDGGNEIALKTLKGITVVIDNLAKAGAAEMGKEKLPINRDKLAGIITICAKLGVPTAGVRQAVRDAGIETTKKGKNVYVRESDRELVEQIAKALHEQPEVTIEQPAKVEAAPAPCAAAIGTGVLDENEEAAAIAVIEQGVKDAGDQRLVDELRARGYNVTCTKLVEKVIYEEVSL